MRSLGQRQLRERLFVGLLYSLAWGGVEHVTVALQRLFVSIRRLLPLLVPLKVSKNTSSRHLGEQRQRGSPLDLSLDTGS